MTTGFGMILAAIMGAALVPSPTMAQQKTTNEPPARPAEKRPPDTFRNEKEKASYSLGVTFGNQIKLAGFEADVDVIVAAMRDVFAGRELRITEQQARQAIQSYQQEAKRKLAEKNRKAGEAFFAENRTKPGVKAHMVTLSDGREAEMQYKVITQGTGVTPKSNDVVSICYRGTLINGSQFNNTTDRGHPLKQRVDLMLRGLAEALQIMKVGDKWEVYLPSSLAYGDRGFGPEMESGSTVIFEIELLSVEPPAAPPSATHPQPSTNDIIKAPSAEELKKGAKFEVIKPEDAAKLAKGGGAEPEEKKN